LKEFLLNWSQKFVDYLLIRLIHYVIIHLKSHLWSSWKRSYHRQHVDKCDAQKKGSCWAHYLEVKIDARCGLRLNVIDWIDSSTIVGPMACPVINDTSIP
jgi:hypothetical protein